MDDNIFGLGYVGSVSAACFADAGHKVVGVDTAEEKVAMINAGTPPVFEPGLVEIMKKVNANGNLRATLSCSEAIEATDVALICVGTPSLPSGSLDLRAVVAVGKQIGEAIKNRKRRLTVVLRSTVLPGTVHSTLLPAIHEGCGGEAPCPLDVAVNPEFLRESTAVADFRVPPMTLAGFDDPATEPVLRELYSSIEAPFVATDLRVAELVKYASNAYHALKIGFANEIGDICEAVGAPPQEVMRIFRMDHRLNISEAYLKPGFAFGGSCLPKDLRALTYAARTKDLKPLILESILPANDQQVERGISQVLATGKRKIGVVGLAFKPDTDDLREGPMVKVIETLLGKGYELRVLDTGVSMSRLMGANKKYIEEHVPHLAGLLCKDEHELLADAEVVVLGNKGADSDKVLAAVREDQRVIDLTRMYPEVADHSR